MGMALLLPCVARAATVTLPQNAKVIKVVDGDTLVVKDSSTDYTLRLIGIDAPEAHPSAKLDADVSLTKQDKGVVLALGKASADFVKTLCQAKACRVEYDKANAETGHRDAYGRLLAYLWIRDARGKSFLVNAEIVREGYARATTDHPFDKDYKDSFVRLQQEARVARRGIWARASDVPWPQLSEATLVGNRKSKKYHKPTCNSIERMSPDNRVEFQSTDEAKNQGYEPCKACNP
jgi:micrococcal nuclease